MRNYKRTSTRQSWNEEDMKNSLKLVINEKKSCREAARAFNLPYSTVLRRYRKYQKFNDVEKVCTKVFVNAFIWKGIYKICTYGNSNKWF